MSKTSGEPFNVCSFCPECLFPRVGKGRAKPNNEMMNQSD